MSFFRNIFGGSKKVPTKAIQVEPTVDSTAGSSSAPRKVNFGVSSDKQEAKVISFASSEDKPLADKQAQEKQRMERLERDDFEELKEPVQEEPITDVDERYDRLDCKLTFRQLQLSKDDVLPGEVLILYEKKLIEMKVKSNTYVPGELILTNYKFMFRPANKELYREREDYFKVPLGLIDKIQKKNENNRKKEALPKLEISLKDERSFKFRFPIIDTMKKICDEVVKWAFVTHKRHFFAFRHFQANRELQEKYCGWQTYDIEKELLRMGLQLMPHSEKLVGDITSDYKFLDNRDGKICSTYPRLLVVPSRLAYDYIVRCSLFRSRERLPVLTYAIETQGKLATLFRCSQPKVGINKSRCTEDEMMIRMIGDPRSEIREQFKGKPNCRVYDARGYYAAVGNMVAGKGYEIAEFYKNCQIEWLDIPNIHAVRDSYVKFKGAAFEDDSKFSGALADSGWYDLIFGILSGARSVASNLLKGTNCVVHCSDGWDRTAQLCALAQVLLDPFYRTIEGFQVLIEKDFVSFGHQFCLRTSQGMNLPNNEQKSQVFLQFLDCMTQLIYQFPLSFEFTIRYITEIAKRLNTNQFGTFLCDSQLQLLKTNVTTRTISLWSYLNHNRDTFLNPYYQPGWARFLDVSCAQKNVRIWKEHFLYYTEGFKDVYAIYPCDFSDENPIVIHSQKKKENQLLRQKHADNQRQIRKLQQQIEAARARKTLREQQA